ncbi:nucleotide disphospho-sugar-binding domain-containing protein [Streptomyces sp. NPDC059639]|uniref:nucleotide disphospho-sugar-binding domain-containing protein n=1 Tax=Streptomyces sp. NPDC059639 TaxID=3346891 RepID=UPI0036784D2D
MKVLLTPVPATAHFYPLVPLAGALVAAGHQVRVATHPELTDVVTGAGLTAVPVGEDDFLTTLSRQVDRGDALHSFLTATLADSGVAGHVRTPIPPRAVLSAFTKYFDPGPPDAGHVPAVDDLVSFARSWRPDLIVWDPMFHPAPVAAAAVGAAHARFLWSVDDMGWTRDQLRLAGVESGGPRDVMAQRMRPTLDRFGLKFTEDLLVGQWTIDPMPPRMRVPTSLRGVAVRPVPYTGPAAVSDWLRSAPRRPRIAISAGVSMRKSFASGIRFPLAGLLEATAALDVEVVATLNDAQLATVGRIPDHVRVVEYVPLDLLLPTCSAVVHHGGGRTFATAVAHRVPQLVCPSDGPHVGDIGRYVAEQGAGLVVDSDPFDVDVARGRLARLLTDPLLREGTDRLHADMLAVPSPAELVPVLERLTAQFRTV